MRITYLTAGAAGMYCGSCLHDNAIAKSMIQLGHDAMLVPTYTPIMTDETDVSSDQLFYGGLNVYLQQLSPLFRWIPRWSDNFLSSPKLVGWVASKAMGTSAGNLGPLTVSMLKGTKGRQKKEVYRLCDWLQTQQPDVLVFSNLLIAGAITEVKKRLRCPVVVILQGDDIFYEGLQQPHRDRAMRELRRLAQQVDKFIVHSRDYGARMQQLLRFPEERLAVSPLSIDVSDYTAEQIPTQRDDESPTIGYLARLAPEKGLHVLVDAFIQLHQSHPELDARLAIAGWLGAEHEDYWQKQQEKLRAAGLSEKWTYWGSVSREDKLDFLRSIDVLSVPTTYLEPKGLFVLEALAAGVPYIQPAHGAFPELHQRLGGGYLFDPNVPTELVTQLAHVFSNISESRELAELGRTALFHSSTTMHEAKHLIELFGTLRDSNMC